MDTSLTAVYSDVNKIYVPLIILWLMSLHVVTISQRKTASENIKHVYMFYVVPANHCSRQVFLIKDRK